MSRRPANRNPATVQAGADDRASADDLGGEPDLGNEPTHNPALRSMLAAKTAESDAAAECVFLDTTALIARYLEGPSRDVVLRAMRGRDNWCASSLALSEAMMLVDRLGDDPGRTDELRRAIRDDWERIHVVPVDQQCLDTAAELGRHHPIRTVDAIHLAAAARLPFPTTFVTFDPAQIPVALAMGLAVPDVNDDKG